MERKLQGKSLFLLPQVPYPTISGDLFKVKVSLIFIVLKLKKKVILLNILTLRTENKESRNKEI